MSKLRALSKLNLALVLSRMPVSLLSQSLYNENSRTETCLRLRAHFSIFSTIVNSFIALFNMPRVRSEFLSNTEMYETTFRFAVKNSRGREDIRKLSYDSA